MNEIAVVKTEIDIRKEKNKIASRVITDEKIYETNDESIFKAETTHPKLHEYDSYKHFHESIIIVFSMLQLDLGTEEQIDRGEGSVDIPDRNVLKAIIYPAIIGSYKQINAQDIIFAFLLAISEKLFYEVNGTLQPVCTKLFGKKFGLEFFSRIMNPYINYKREVIFRVRARNKSKERDIPINLRLDDGSKNKNKQANINVLTEHFDRYVASVVNKTTFDILLPSVWYDSLVKENILIIETEKWEKFAIEGFAAAKRKSMQTKEGIKDFMQNRLLENTTIADIETKKLLLIDFFEKLRLEGKHIKDCF